MRRGLGISVLLLALLALGAWAHRIELLQPIAWGTGVDGLARAPSERPPNGWPPSCGRA